jgi:hypothetical protein
VVAKKVAGGPVRVQSVSRTAITKFIMNTVGVQYMAMKLQPTLTPFYKEQRKWWADNFHLFWDRAKLLRTKT